MSGPSSIGFGYQPFGSEEFGSADWAEEVTWKIIPDFYREEDQLGTAGLVAMPLRGFIDSIKPLFQEIIDKLEIFPTLWDANLCPFPQLPALSYNVGITLSSIQTLQLTSILAAPFTFGERVIGSDSGSSGFISIINSSVFTIISVIGPGFRIGESIVGQTSGRSAQILAITGAIPTQVLTLQTFIIGEQIIGSRTSTRGNVGTFSSNTININTITGIGFENGEEITGQQSGATAVINGITIDGRSENLLRSQVLGASQLWINKGTDKGYQIVAAFEGLFAIVTPLWAERCDPDPDGELLTILPPDAGTYLTFFDDVPADKLPMDFFFLDPFSAWPRPVESVRILATLPDGRCRSYSLRLYFTTPDDTEIEDFDSVSARILANAERFRPIHVRFDSITFDGPHASSELWRLPDAVAESYAAGLFTTSITGSLLDSSEIWTLDSFSATNTD